MPERISLTGEYDPFADIKGSYEDYFYEDYYAAFGDMYADLGTELDSRQEQPDSEWWSKWFAVLLGIFVLRAGTLASETAEATMGLSGIGLDMDAIIAESTNWARTYGFDLITNINESRRNALQTALQSYQSHQDIEILKGQVAPLFGEARARAIAITETSRAAERGVDIYEQKLNQSGIITDRIWHTMQDENVCPICEPNDGKLRSSGEWTVSGIPAHPNDRCWTELVTVRR